MDEMTSSEFRRRYATLTKQTIVTVLGRPIGQWNPIPLDHAVASLLAARMPPTDWKGDFPTEERMEIARKLLPDIQRQVFRPAPKPRAKGK